MLVERGRTPEVLMGKPLQDLEAVRRFLLLLLEVLELGFLLQVELEREELLRFVEEQLIDLARVDDVLDG